MTKNNPIQPSKAETTFWLDYGAAVLGVLICTAAAFAMTPFFAPTNLAMVYLLGTLVVAARGHRGPAALSAALNVVAFDFCFVPPRFSFGVRDAQYLWTFVVMFVVAMIISHLTVRLREEAEAARQEEKRSAWLMEKAKKAEIEAESERLRSSLLSSVSHDFRTPLTAIVGSAGTLLSRGEFQQNPAARELLENIQEEAERLSHLVQNLLEVTRLESSDVGIHKELVPLEEVIGGALERLEKPLRGRTVDVAVPESLPPAPMDAVLLEQVFVNLLENAVRHTPEKTAIAITAAVRDLKNIVVTVADRGPGLKEEELERVFDKFYHAAASPGAGLGLAICRAIVRAHGGRIRAENRPGGGASFEFTLPLELTHGG